MADDIITKEEEVTGSAYIWAIPNRNPDEHGPGAFYYRVMHNPWETGAIKVHTFEVKGTVPAGINLIEAALQTIEDKKNEIQARAFREVQDLEKEKEKLLKLTYRPEPEEDDIDLGPGVSLIRPDDLGPGIEDDIPF